MSGLFFSVSQSFAQEITIGEKPQQLIEITIDKSGIAHVVHKVEGSTKTQQVDTFEGTMSNLSVTDTNSDEVQYMTLEKYPLSIVLPPSKKDLILIKYDLIDVLSLMDGVWTWNYTGTEITSFYFPDDVDIIWINDNPIYLSSKGIRHHGGLSRIEYVVDEPIVLKTVEWEGKKFTVGVRTQPSIDNFEFSQPTKSITFDVHKENSLTSIIIPRVLLWDPYDVYINTNQTGNSEFYNNGTHVWLGFRPETVGTIKIMGTTAIPEFPVFVPLVIAISIVLVLQFRSKLSSTRMKS